MPGLIRTIGFILATGLFGLSACGDENSPDRVHTNKPRTRQYDFDCDGKPDLCNSYTYDANGKLLTIQQDGD